MKPEIALLWAEALESGEYLQTTDQLRNGNKYCCLGVLCDLHRKITDKGEWQNNCYFGASVDLPCPVSEWAGIENNEANPTIGSYSATTLNDDKRFSFEEIARRIRKEYLT